LRCINRLFSRLVRIGCVVGSHSVCFPI
jgi:hypothetical protein